MSSRCSDLLSILPKVMFLQQMSCNSGSFPNPFQSFRLLTSKRTHELDAVFQHCFCCWYMYLKIKKITPLSLLAFPALVPRLSHTLRLLLSAELCWEYHHRVRSLCSNEFSRCPSSRRLDISSRYSPVFSQHPFWPHKFCCSVFVDLGRWRKEGYLGLITVFMKTKKCNDFSTKLVF